ncbi:multicomponent Na+:H+ antiporter subunit E [Arcanobacterium wilhelmae]|uniref:Multicomponent Na+:H+ antiporter subunit E n=1 Tax=Arcanobacterium wilhelmae TaxID=1803177 RepID=A0ABT9NAK3_9ACTO|nr:Na+/H+ antiporter subunit E [Arcanobacterium wilhelmae]MDP9800728.1 multicomponent Na+:H+ antiporter subunit E [Arcanobacterium wilhelmae]WFN90127.1 Na+/H+ antiporter subunit E [Arcanobacterium wilhelmae]
MSKARDAIRYATRRPGRFPHASVGLLIGLTAVWVFLWGDPSTGNVVAGFLVALLVTTVTPFPTAPFDGRFRPLGVAILLWALLRDVLVSSAQLAWFILRGREPHGAVIRVHLRGHSDFRLAMVAGLTAIVPGSVVIETHRETSTVYVHVFDVGQAGGIEGVHRSVLEVEEHVLRAFASHDELLAAGFVPGSRTSAGRLPTPFAPVTGEEGER